LASTVRRRVEEPVGRPVVDLVEDLADHLERGWSVAGGSPTAERFFDAVKVCDDLTNFPRWTKGLHPPVGLVEFAQQAEDRAHAFEQAVHFVNAHLSPICL
jgi:hypothetical protein